MTSDPDAHARTGAGDADPDAEPEAPPPGPAARPARRPAAAHRHRRRPWPTPARALAAGTGPVAIDAERASGYRYSSRAYLIQLRREGAGTVLVDPIAFDSLAPLQEALDGTEWILHAATQDLPCLAEVGLRPDRALRHRAGRPAARLPAGRAGHAGRDAARLPDEEGALRRRLVDAAAARAVAGVRRPRRRGARRAARRAGRASWSRPARTSGRARSSTHLRGFDARRPRRAVAAYLRAAPGPRAPRCSAPSASCGRPATSSPGERDVTPGPDHPRRRDRRGRAWRCRPTSADAAGDQGLPRPRRRALRRPLGRRRSRGRASMPEDDLPARAPRDRRPAARRAPGPSATRSPPSASTLARDGDRRAVRGARASRPRTCSPPTPCAA